MDIKKAVLLAMVFAACLVPNEAYASLERYEAQLERAVAAIEAEDYDFAIDRLEELEAVKPEDVEVLFYLGQAYWLSGDFKEGARYFRRVRELSPESEHGKVAARYLDALKQRQVRPYYLRAYTGLQYDSNVPLTPNSGLVARLKEDDYAWVFYIRGGYGYHVEAVPGLSLNASYDFYQNLHFDLDEFDVQDHDLKLFPAYVRGPLTGLLAYNLSYTFLGGSGFERAHGFVPKLRYAVTPELTVELYYNFEDREFFEGDRRDSGVHKYAADVYYYFMDRRAVARLGQYHEDENAFGEEWDFHGSGTVAGVSAPLPWELKVVAEGEYQYRRYGKGLSSRHQDFRNRVNRNKRLSAALSKRLTRELGVIASYTYMDQDSTFEEFDYDRHLVSVLVSAQF